MVSLLFTLIINLNYLLAQAQNLPYSYGRVDLVFYYSAGKSSTVTEIPVTALLVRKSDADNAFVLQGAMLNNRKLVIKSVTCADYCNSFTPCRVNFLSIVTIIFLSLKSYAYMYLKVNICFFKI